MEMKGSYKVPQYQCHRVRLVCDMEMKGSYKADRNILKITSLVCDMEMKGSYKLRSLTLALLLACM